MVSSLPSPSSSSWRHCHHYHYHHRYSSTPSIASAASTPRMLVAMMFMTILLLSHQYYDDESSSSIVIMVNAATCVPYDPIMAPTYAGVIPTGQLTYIDEVVHFNLSQLESEVISSSLVLNGIQSSVCRTSFAQLTASRAFLPCDIYYWTQLSMALPRLPCRSSCLAVKLLNCSGDDLNLIRYLNMGDISCITQGRYVAGQDDYPLVSTTFAPGVTTMCYGPDLTTVTPPLYGQCLPYTGSICSGIITSSDYIYVPAGMCITQIEQQLQSLPVLWRSLTSDTCARATASLLCHTYFPKCDNTSVTNQLTSFTTLFGTLPPIALPSFTSQETCLGWQQSCPLDILTQYVTALAPDMTTVGWVTNLEQDYMKISALMGTQTPNCLSVGINAPDGQADYPTNNMTLSRGTIWANITTLFGQLILSTPSYTPSVDASTINIEPLLPSCAIFNSTNIINNTPLYNIDGSKRTDAPRSFCHGIIPEGTPIYIPPGASLVALNEAIRGSQWLFGLAPTANGCNLAFMQYACWQAFLPCVTDLLSFSVVLAPSYLIDGTKTPLPHNITIKSAFPSFPCQSICETYSQKCSSFIATNPMLQPNCTKRSLAPSGPLPYFQKTVTCNGDIATPGQLDFPFDSTWFTSLAVPFIPAFTHLGVTLPLFPMSLTVASRCNGNSTAVDIPGTSVASFRILPEVNQMTAPYTCPWPSMDPRTVAGVDWDEVVYLEGSSCSLVCPQPLYTEGEYNMTWKMFQVTLFISWVLSLWLVVTYTIFKERRERVLLYSFMIAVFACCTSLIMAARNPREQVCKNAIQDHQQGRKGSATCVAQGFFFEVTALMAIIWWTVQSLDVFIQVTASKRFVIRNKAKLRQAYNLVAWPIPIIMSIATAGKGIYGQYRGIAWCLWSNGGIEADHTYDWVTFYGPVAICLAIGFFCMGAVIIVIIKTASSTGRRATDQLRLVLRPICFIAIFLFVFTVTFYYKIYDQWGSDDAKENVITWITCKVSVEPYQYYVLNNGAFTCGDKPPNGPSLSLFYMMHFVVGVQGILIFINYGTESRNFYLWANLIKGRRRMAGSKGSKGSKGSIERGDGSGGTGSGGTASPGASTERPGLVRGITRDLMKGPREGQQSTVSLTSTGSPMQSPQMMGHRGESILGKPQFGSVVDLMDEKVIGDSRRATATSVSGSNKRSVELSILSGNGSNGQSGLPPVSEVPTPSASASTGLQFQGDTHTPGGHATVTPSSAASTTTPSAIELKSAPTPVAAGSDSSSSAGVTATTAPLAVSSSSSSSARSSPQSSPKNIAPIPGPAGDVQLRAFPASTSSHGGSHDNLAAAARRTSASTNNNSGPLVIDDTSASSSATVVATGAPPSPVSVAHPSTMALTNDDHDDSASHSSAV